MEPIEDNKIVIHDSVRDRPLKRDGKERGYVVNISPSKSDKKGERLQIEFGDLILVDAKHECSIISVCRLQQIELFADVNGSTDVHICSLGFTCAIVLRQF